MSEAKRLSKVCLALLGRVRLARLWTEKGPTQEARELLDQNGGPLSSGERVVLLVAWALWNGAGNLTVAELVERLFGSHLAAIGTLLVSMSHGRDGIDDWLAVQLEEKGAVVRDVEQRAVLEQLAQEAVEE